MSEAQVSAKAVPGYDVELEEYERSVPRDDEEDEGDRNVSQKPKAGSSTSVGLLRRAVGEISSPSSTGIQGHRI